MDTNRAGTFLRQPSGYSTFMPRKLPPDPALQIDNEMIHLLSEADRKLGRLDGITQILPNPDLFVAMYVKKEAVLSSQIEGTQASFIDLFEAEKLSTAVSPVTDVVNYVAAMNYGLLRLNEFPLSLRLIRDIHGVLLQSGRGALSNPSEFRTTQNWIGPAGCSLNNAVFVPPAVPEMMQALSDLELFFYDESDIPALIKIGLIHAQFETIHPFADGNGRMGRLLITFWLCQQKILSEPLLYLSYYFKQNRTEYYDRLMDIRIKGQWEEWIKFFLKGIASVATESTETAKEILKLREYYLEICHRERNSNAAKLLEQLFYQPVITKKETSVQLGTSLPTANTLLNDFVERGILFDIDPTRQRNKRYAFSKYLAILQRGTELDASNHSLS
jgi:Fic family protein